MEVAHSWKTDGRVVCLNCFSLCYQMNNISDPFFQVGQASDDFFPRPIIWTLRIPMSLTAQHNMSHHGAYKMNTLNKYSKWYPELLSMFQGNNIFHTKLTVSKSLTFLEKIIIFQPRCFPLSSFLSSLYLSPFIF